MTPPNHMNPIMITLLQAAFQLVTLQQQFHCVPDAADISTFGPAVRNHVYDLLPWFVQPEIQVTTQEDSVVVTRNI